MEEIKEKAVAPTSYKTIKNNIVRQHRLIEDMGRKKAQLEKSLLEQSEKLAETLLDAVDKGEIHIVDAYAYWGMNNDHLPIHRWIDSEFLDTRRRDGVDRRQTVLYSDWLEIGGEDIPPPIAKSAWKEYLEELEEHHDIQRYNWASSKTGEINYEGIFAMMRRLIANGQKGFVCDW